jgi:pimeloyl-ACP methyl ester carboxylesterase
MADAIVSDNQGGIMAMNTARAHVLPREGSNLHYWTAGPQDGPLVVLTHGATLDHHMFAAQVAPLAAAGYRVLTWDMRGHGLSKPMGTRFTLEIVADDLLAIVDRVGGDAATFVGHSFGGFVSQEVVRRHPERVRALGVIACTDLTRKPAAGMRVAYRLLPHILPLMSVSTFRKRTVQDLSTRAEVKQYGYDATGRLSKDEFIAVIMAGVACLAVVSGHSATHTIPCPFLLTHGDQDTANRGVFAKHAPAWADKEPNCTYRVVPGAGHTANQDNPEAFNEMLLEFLDRTSA